MERIAIEAELSRVLQAPETNALAKQSTQSLNATQLKQLGELMKQTKQSFPNQEIPRETLDMWFPAWMTLATAYGMAAVERALREHMLASRFFPQPAELRERLEAMRPARANVYVPSTRREFARLVGSAIAARVSEPTVVEVEKQYGAESARLYRAKLERERRG
jgi:hypothetical protein